MLPPIRRLIAVPLVTLLLSTSAFAADVTPEGATALKTVVQGYLDERARLSTAKGDQLMQDGPLTVEPASGYYAVTLPHLKLRQSSGNTVDMGIISINALPGSTDKEWKMAVALASPIKFTDAEGKPDGEIKFGQQKLSGLWNTDLNSYSQLDARYADIVFTNPKETTTITLPETIITYDLKQTAPGLWSGPIVLDTKNISVVDPTEKTTITVQNARWDMTVKDHNPAEVKKFNEQMATIIETQKVQDMPKATDKHALGMYNLLADYLAKSSDGFTSDTKLTGMTFASTDAATGAEKTFTIDNSAFNFSADGFMKDSVNMRLALSYEGFHTTPAPTTTNSTIPTKISFDMALNKLPFKALTELGRTTLQQSQNGPQAADLAKREAVLKLPGILTQAGTNISISNTEFASPDYRAFLNGVVTANVAAVKSFTADINGEVKGLDQLVQKLTPLANDPNNPAAGQIKQSLSGLAMLQMMGQQKQDDPTTRTYSLKVDEQGKVTLNGADMSALMGGAGGGNAGPAVQPAPVAPR